MDLFEDVWAFTGVFDAGFGDDFKLTTVRADAKDTSWVALPQADATGVWFEVPAVDVGRHMRVGTVIAKDEEKSATTVEVERPDFPVAGTASLRLPTGPVTALGASDEGLAGATLSFVAADGSKGFDAAVNGTRASAWAVQDLATSAGTLKVKAGAETADVFGAGRRTDAWASVTHPALHEALGVEHALRGSVRVATAGSKGFTASGILGLVDAGRFLPFLNERTLATHVYLRKVVGLGGATTATQDDAVIVAAKFDAHHAMKLRVDAAGGAAVSTSVRQPLAGHDAIVTVTQTRPAGSGGRMGFGVQLLMSI